MTEQEVRKHVNKIITEMIENEELDENLVHASISNQNVATGVQNHIENVFPEYSEEDKTFLPQKVSEKQY